MGMIDTILSQTREHMKKSIEITRNDLTSIRSGRANPALVENIVINAYGGTQKMKLLEMATITTQDAKTILIAPYDPSQVGDISKGIQEAHAGLNPNIDGELLRIVIPPLSEERRLEYIKLAKAKLEAGRIMIRQVRQEAMKDIKKAKETDDVSEDQEAIGEKKVQELTDEMIAEVDVMGQRKEQELLQV
jgi:ribosome recycling factor